MNKFENNCLMLAKRFGYNVSEFNEIPADLRLFFEGIGPMRVCAIFVISDLKEGKSERRVARIYGITRRQVQTIRGWNKKGVRAKKTIVEP